MRGGWNTALQMAPLSGTAVQNARRTALNTENNPVPLDTSATIPVNAANADFISRLQSYLGGSELTPAEKQLREGQGRAQNDVSSTAATFAAGQNVGDLQANAANAHSDLEARQNQDYNVLRGYEMPGLIQALGQASMNQGADALNTAQATFNNSIANQTDLGNSLSTWLGAASSQQNNTSGADQARVNAAVADYQTAVAKYGQDSSQAKEKWALVLGIIGTVAGATAGTIIEPGGGTVAGAALGGSLGSSLGQAVG
jgi:hypothetical protein